MSTNVLTEFENDFIPEDFSSFFFAFYNLLNE